MDQIVIGVDTHKSNHIAVVINAHGARLGSTTIPATQKGYRDLETWAARFGQIKAFGIEGTGSYGAGLSRDLLAKGHTVLDVMRPNRQLRYLQQPRCRGRGQVGAERAGIGPSKGADRVFGNDPPSEDREGLCGQSQVPGDDYVEDADHKRAVRSARCARSGQRADHVGSIHRGVPAGRRYIDNGFRQSCDARYRTSLAGAARRNPGEIQAHEHELDRMVREKAPELMQSFGISTLTVAQMLILVGDNPDRIKSEAALAKMCGVCPIPASSGKTNRMRLNRGGNRQANAALYRVAIVRMRDDEKTKAYATRRTAEGKTRREIVRCIKRYIIREIYRALCVSPIKAASA